MATIKPETPGLRVDRRGLISLLLATTVAVGTASRICDPEPASATEVIHSEPPLRQRCDVEAWNVGMITAYQPDLSKQENETREYQKI